MRLESSTWKRLATNDASGDDEEEDWLLLLLFVDVAVAFQPLRPSGTGAKIGAEAGTGAGPSTEGAAAVLVSLVVAEVVEVVVADVVEVRGGDVPGGLGGLYEGFPHSIVGERSSSSSSLSLLLLLLLLFTTVFSLA